MLENRRCCKDLDSPDAPPGWDIIDYWNYSPDHIKSCSSCELR